jgi:hypothetical protein
VNGENPDSTSRPRRSAIVVLLLVALVLLFLAFSRLPGSRSKDAPPPKESAVDTTAPPGADAATAAAAEQLPVPKTQAPAQIDAASPEPPILAGVFTRPHAAMPTHPTNELWDPLGRCRYEPLAAQAERRKELLRTFVARSVDGISFYVDPDVSASDLDRLAEHVPHAKRYVEGQLGLASTLPEIYVYDSIASLQRWSCVPVSAVAYYDGAIHVALEFDQDWKASFLHEYVHHVLASAGIRGPMWFHEGTAMLLAREHWWEPPLHEDGFSPRLRIDQMLDPMVAGISEDDAVAYYMEAVLMVRCLFWLRAPGYREQVAALRNRTTDATGLFAWSAKVDPARLQQAFDEFVRTREIHGLRDWQRKYVVAGRRELLDPPP